MSQVRRAVVMTNRSAGRGRAAAASDVLMTRLRAAGVEVAEVVRDDAAAAAREAAALVDAGADALIAVGGDGTVGLAADLLRGRPARLGVVPAGSGNDLARALGLPRDPAAAAERIVAGSTRRIDLAVVQGRALATVLACGFDALVAERADRLPRAAGALRYLAATAAELRTLRPRLYRIEVDGVVHEVPAVLAAVGNTACFGGGMRIAEGAEPDDGLLDVVLVGPVSRVGLLRAFPRVYGGTHVGHPAYRRLRGRRIVIEAPGITAYGDGEPFGRLPLTIEVDPGCLEVLA